MSPERFQQIDRILQDALEVAPEERSALLEQACANDEELRRAVESLIASREQASDFMETPAIKVDAGVIAGERHLADGSMINHYRVVELLGAGGMGEVYSAQDTRLRRKVALKILPLQFTRREERVRRFEQEARAASALNHPNILTIYEINSVDDVYYIATELVEGETLRERMMRTRINRSELLDIAVQLASALTIAHEAGIVHRDIKPENIMIRTDGYVKVLDFGLAKLVEQPSSDSNPESTTQHLLQTAPGMVMGTVSYMSPEQARGLAVDARTDIWSLGVVLYEMAAQRRPFDGETVNHTLISIMEREPPALSVYGGDALAELERIVMKALAKKPDERYQSARDVLNALRQLKKRLEVEDELERTTSASKPNETKAKLIKTETRNSIAVLPFANMSADAENEFFCDGLAEELLNALAKIDDLSVAARTSAFSFKGKNTNVSEIGAALNVNTILEGSVRRSGNRLRITVQLVKASNGYHLWSERYDREMQDIFDVQDEITLSVVDALKVKLLGEERAAILKRYTDNPRAYELYLQGMYYRWKLAPEEFRKCGDYFHRAVDADPTFALAYFGLASYYGYGTAWGLLPIPPEEGWAKAEAAMEKVLELDATLPETVIGNAFKLVHYRQWSEAGAGIERAAAANPKFSEIHLLYSFYLLAVGRFDDAIAEARRALELDPLSLNYSRTLNICFFFARRYDEAIKQLNSSLELEPNNPSVYEILGGVFAQKAMFAEAVAAWQKMARLEGDDELAARLDRAKDRFAEAARAIGQRRIEQMRAKTDAGEFVPAINFARAYLMLGDEERAFEWLEKAVEERNVFPLLMNSDPFYDPIRADSRFQDLLRRVGFSARATDALPDKKTSALHAKTEDAAPPVHPTSSAEYLVNQVKRHKSGTLVSLVAVVIAAVSVAYFSFGKHKNIDSLAVLPFTNVGGDPNTEYLSDGVTESIINSLSQLAQLKVMARSTVFRYKGRDADPQEVGRALGVNAVLTGKVSQRGDTLSIQAELVDARDGTQLWGEQYNRRLTDILTLQGDIAQQISQKLRTRLTGEEQRRVTKNYTQNVEAYQLYLRGRFEWNKFTPEGIQKSIDYYNQAITIDPAYALAFAGLSDSYGLQTHLGFPVKEGYTKAKWDAERALQLDDTLAESHQAMGAVNLFYDWDWPGAEREAQRAIELNRNFAPAYNVYSSYLKALGRHAEGLTISKRAQEIDPLSPLLNSEIAELLLFAGLYDEAIAQGRKTLELDPHFFLAHNVIARAYEQKGMYTEAAAEFEKMEEVLGRDPLVLASLGHVAALSGTHDEAQKILGEMKELAKQRYVPSYWIAMVYAGLGDKDQAFAWLEKAYDERFFLIVWLKGEPRFANLRSDPRFQDLMRRMNLNSDERK